MSKSPLKLCQPYAPSLESNVFFSRNFSVWWCSEKTKRRIDRTKDGTKPYDHSGSGAEVSPAFRLRRRCLFIRLRSGRGAAALNLVLCRPSCGTPPPTHSRSRRRPPVRLHAPCHASRAPRMEKALTKLSSFTIPRKAKQELTAIGGDISRLSSTVEEKAKWVFEKLKGKSNKSLSDLLREYNLPPGLFPRNIICYEYDQSSSKLVVHLAKPCEVSFKDSSMIRYAPRIKATLSRGKLSAIEGMKTKVVVWVKVTSINLESFRSDKVCFIAGVKKLRQKDAYEMPREAVSVEEF